MTGLGIRVFSAHTHGNSIVPRSRPRTAHPQDPGAPRRCNTDIYRALSAAREGRARRGRNSWHDAEHRCAERDIYEGGRRMTGTNITTRRAGWCSAGAHIPGSLVRFLRPLLLPHDGWPERISDQQHGGTTDGHTRRRVAAITRLSGNSASVSMPRPVRARRGHAWVAQLAERRVPRPQRAGSSPAPGVRDRFGCRVMRGENESRLVIPGAVAAIRCLSAQWPTAVVAAGRFLPHHSSRHVCAAVRCRDAAGGSFPP